MKKILLVLIILQTSLSLAQGYKWGFSASKSEIYLTDNYQVFFSWPQIHIQDFERKLNYQGYGFHYVGSWSFWGDNEFIIKPGVLISRNPFGGIELGVKYKRTLLTDYKIGLGIAANIHDFFSWSNGESANTTYELSVERRIIKETFLGISFIKPLGDRNFGYSDDRIIGGEMILGYSKSQLNYMLKAYIEYYF